jgi:hypothetical protein
MHLSLRESLRHHERHNPRAGAYVKNALPTNSPRAEQHSVRTHLHGTQFLMHYKMPEPEKRIWHKCCCRKDGAKIGKICDFQVFQMKKTPSWRLGKEMFSLFPQI